MENKELNECFYWMRKLNPDFKILAEAGGIMGGVINRQ